MMDIVVGLIIITILGAAIGKYVSEKRKGVKCVGCPMSGLNPKMVQIRCDYPNKNKTN